MANRSQRRNRSRPQRLVHAGFERKARRGLEAAAVFVLPGLPGGPPYVTARERDEVMEETIAAVAEMHPGDVQRASTRERLRIAGRRIVRYRREEVPGFGKGVVLGEFEPDVEPVFDWKPAPGGGVIFDG